VIDERRIVVRAAEPVGVARGLSTLIQLLATTPSTSASEVSLPATSILDAPRYAWRGLSLDLARTFFTVGEVKGVIDLLTHYKLNVLHLHLTDDQSWRLPVGRSAHVFCVHPYESTRDGLLIEHSEREYHRRWAGNSVTLETPHCLISIDIATCVRHTMVCV
jgi:hypothetical protein